MNVACPSCQTRYSVDDARIPPSGVTIKCPKCQHAFVTKRDSSGQAQTQAPRPQSAVALPGNKSTAVPLPGKTEAKVPLPGRGPPGAKHGAPSPDLDGLEDARDAAQAAGGGDDELDLGLDEPAPSRAAASKPAPKAPAQAARSSARASDSIGFIDETASRAGVSDEPRGGSTEFKIRRRNGRVEGPYGVGRVVAMLRNKELSGGEDLSEDGVTWRPLSTNPQLGQVINDLAASDDDLGYGQPEAGGGGASPKKGAKPAPAKRPSSDDELELSSPLDGLEGAPKKGSGPSGEFNLGFEEDDNHETTAPKTRPSPRGSYAFSGEGQDEVELDRRDDESPRGRKAHAADDAPRRGGDTDGRASGDLDVGEIPQLPPVWKTYRKPIIAFAAAMVIVLIGVFTHLHSPCGAFGLKCVASLLQPPPPPPPAPPPPPPARLADPKEITHLTEEGSFEGYRSVLATIEKLGPSVPDNMLAGAKARGFATLAFGPPEFTIDELRKAADAVEKLDPAKAFGGNSAKTKLEVLKVRAALALASAAVQPVLPQLQAALEQRSDDKEIALLLGLARGQAKDQKGALEALDKAIVIDSKYAPALHAIGEVVASLGNKEEAAEWFVKAIDAQPACSRSGVAAADLYAQLDLAGQHRRVLALAAQKVTRGLPPDKRSAVVFDAAKAFVAVDQMDAALPLAKEAARLDPGNAKAVAMEALATGMLGDPKVGQKQLDPVLQREPQNIDALIARARLFMRQGDVAKAFIDLEAARKVQADNPRLLLLEARFNIELGKLSDARDAIGRVSRMNAKSDEAEILLGDLALNLGDIDAALESATAAVKKQPSDAAAHAILGACYLTREQLDDALQEFTAARRLDDEGVKTNIGYANVIRDMGAKGMKGHKVSEAIPLYLQLLSKSPRDPSVLYEYGRALELQGKLDAAMDLYREAAAIDQKDVGPHLKMVAANLEKEPPDLAAAEKSMAIARKIEEESGHQNGNVRFWQARLDLANGKLHDAESALRVAVDLQPRNALFYYWLARSAEANNSLFEAVGYYEKALSLNSRLAAAYRALGRTAVERNQFEKAREAFDKYRDTAPDDHTVWLEIGESYTKQNREEEAMKAFQEVLKWNPKSAKALLEIGVILDHRGENKEAQKYFERATKADPGMGDGWCYYGASLAASDKVTGPTRAALDRCIAAKNSSEDLRAQAREILSAPPSRTN